jgi:hypothetical protein
MTKIKYIELIISIATMLITVGICWGIVQERLKNIEGQQSRYGEDHDTIIRIATTLERTQKDIAEIKLDVKEIKASMEK